MNCTGLTYYCDAARHLVCKPFSVENLHLMAVDIGINRRWFHSGKHPHYDIPLKDMERVRAKCTVVTQREIWKIIHDS